MAESQKDAALLRVPLVSSSDSYENKSGAHSSYEEDELKRSSSSELFRIPSSEREQRIKMKTYSADDPTVNADNSARLSSSSQSGSSKYSSLERSTSNGSGSARNSFRNSPQNNTPERKPVRGHGLGKSPAMAQRMKFYYKLSSPRGSSGNLILEPPKHVLPQYLFLTPFTSSETGKQSSLATIFSIVTTMMGATILAIPWGFGQSGILLGAFISLFICTISWYTCTLILKNNEQLNYPDFSDLCEHFIGPKIRDFCLATSFLLMLGAGMAYATIITGSVLQVYEFATKVESVEKSLTFYVAIGCVALQYPISCIKDVSTIVKLSSIGTFCMLNLLFFTIYQSVGTHFDHIEVAMKDLAKQGWPNLAGVMFLSYTVHNAIIPMTMSNANPKNNIRDVTISYAIVFLLFSVPAALWWLVYHNDPKSMASNYLKGFPTSNTHAAITRCGMFLQLFIVLPLIMFVIRVLVFGRLYKNIYPGLPHVMALNLLLLGIYYGVAVSGVELGPVLTITGGVCGCMYTYVLPVLVHLAAKRSRQDLSKMSGFGHILIILFGVSIMILQFIPNIF